jgi:hypothetical protein
LIRSGGDVARLLAELRDVDPVRRETAIARLRIIGSRATAALAALASSDHPASARTAALKALEGIDDARAVEAMMTLTADADRGVAVAAIGGLRPWVTREADTRVLETLTSVALDLSRDASVRAAALEAVAQLPRHLVAPLLEQAAPAVPGPPVVDDPLSVLDWLSTNGNAPLSDIHEVIVRLRESERREPSTARLDQWMRARGAAHAVLAARRSTVAVYDLRETFDAATRPLPADFLTAVAAIGDASCLEPIARAWTATAGEDWWRAHLAQAATGIMRREKLTGRNAAVKRIRARWPGFL